MSENGQRRNKEEMLLHSYLNKLFVEPIDKSSQNVTSIRDLLRILTNNPDQTASRVRLIQIIDT